MSWLLSTRNADVRRRGDPKDHLSDAHDDCDMEPMFRYQFRVILIGDSMAGKSSLLRKFTLGSFAEVSDPTVGVDFFARLVRLRDSASVKLQLWDTAGQERFRSITKAYYRNSVGVVLAYDVCDIRSFQSLERWTEEARKHIEPRRAVFVLVGCKRDVAAAERQVAPEAARAFAAKHGCSSFETSAKTGLGVDDVFHDLAQAIYDKVLSGEYRLEDGWDGIKPSYFGGSRQMYCSGTEELPSSSSSSVNLSGPGAPWLEAEPVRRRGCC